VQGRYFTPEGLCSFKMVKFPGLFSDEYMNLMVYLLVVVVICFWVSVSSIRRYVSRRMNEIQLLLIQNSRDIMKLWGESVLFPSFLMDDHEDLRSFVWSAMKLSRTSQTEFARKSRVSVSVLMDWLDRKLDEGSSSIHVADTAYAAAKSVLNITTPESGVYHEKVRIYAGPEHAHRDLFERSSLGEDEDGEPPSVIIVQNVMHAGKCAFMTRRLASKGWSSLLLPNGDAVLVLEGVLPMPSLTSIAFKYPGLRNVVVYEYDKKGGRRLSWSGIGDDTTISKSYDVGDSKVVNVKIPGLRFDID
jgi:hypothetical protein